LSLPINLGESGASLSSFEKNNPQPFPFDAETVSSLK
jgi:hypothetical protein